MHATGGGNYSFCLLVMAQVPEVQVQIQVKTRISGKFQELPEMRQL